jgi:hypothetical protein
MFQYALGRALADANGCELKLDVSGFEQYTLRVYELGDYNIRASIASAQDIARFHEQKKGYPFFEHVSKFFGRAPAPASIFREKAFTFDESVCDFKPSIYLEGYWQSEKYFSRIRSALLKDFTLNAPADEKNRAVFDAMSQCQAVSLHIRRGDYVTNPTAAQFHGVCSLDYYYDAVRLVAQRIEKPHFFVFSDDTQWVLDNLKIDYPLHVVDVNGPDRGIYDMALMKSCRHHIIANSSFSWWGAWLNPSDDKIVVAPKRWFKEGQNDTKDLIPASWTRL